MIIGKAQHSHRSTCATRCILTLLAVSALGLTARAQHPGATATNQPAAPSQSTPAASAIAKPDPAHATPTTEDAVPNDATHQGIKVHGHWKITVHDPDGKFVKEVEFENSLVTPNSADVILSQMLAGQFALAGFLIDVNGGLCNYYYGGLSDCYIVPGATIEATTVAFNNCYYSYAVPYQYCYPGLTQTYVPYNATTKAAAYFQLAGSLTAINSGTISTVSTVLDGCEDTSNSTSLATISDAACSQSTTSVTTNGFFGPSGSYWVNFVTFTQFTLATPLTIAANQVVTVVVTLSFS